MKSINEKAVEYGKDLYKRNGSLLNRCRGCYAHFSSSYEAGANYVLEQIEKQLDEFSDFDDSLIIRRVIEQLKK